MFKVFYILIFLFCAAARADVDKLKADLIQSLSKQFPGSEIELISEPRVIQGRAIDRHHKVSFLNDDTRGNAFFLVDQSQVKVKFAAWVNAITAVRKISPKQKLHHIYFSDKRINIAVGNERQYRGLYLLDRKKLNKLETRRTILAGNYLLTTAVQNIPDVRRGDTIKMKIVGKGLTLTTTATAQQSATKGDNILVTTQKGKKQLKGKLTSKSIVEVRL